MTYTAYIETIDQVAAIPEDSIGMVMCVAIAHLPDDFGWVVETVTGPLYFATAAACADFIMDVA